MVILHTQIPEDWLKSVLGNVNYITTERLHVIHGFQGLRDLQGTSIIDQSVSTREGKVGQVALTDQRKNSGR